MKNNYKINIYHPHQGFTLIEIIVTLVIIGISAAIIAPYFMSGVFESSSLVNRQETIFNLNSVIANMVTDYEKNYINNLNSLSSKIGNVGSQDSKYGNFTNGVYTYLVKSKVYKNIAGVPNSGLEVTISDPNDQIRVYYLFTLKKSAP